MKRSIVTIGGGTGTYTVLTGLKKYVDTIDLTAIVTTADSGGSTGRLRDEFGYLPVGDVRMALTALAGEKGDGEALMRKLFLHRFAKGEGLSGHTVGNLLLVALTDLLGSEEAAIRAASEVLRVCGEVIPVTTEKTELFARYDDGVVISREHLIDEPDESRAMHRILDLGIEPKASLNPRAREALMNADLIIFGPGDLYTSILANLVVGGMQNALAASTARKIFVCNLMTKMGQTHNMTASDHVAEIERYSGVALDAVLVHDQPFDDALFKRYEEEGEFPVLQDIDSTDPRLIFGNFASDTIAQKAAGDVLKRSLIRHDSDKLASAIMKLV